MAASRFPGPMQFDDIATFTGVISAGNPGTLGATPYAGRIDLGAVPIISGAGVPTGNPGVHPVVYLRSDSASVSTIIYVCHTGSTWAAISVP